MGYAGGSKADPTYRSLGDHTESIQIEFDPQRISFDELLQIFWSMHNPTSRSWFTQYKTILFVQNDEQFAAAQRSKAALEEALGHKVRTEIRQLDRFYQAEDYHQKYKLQQDSALMGQISDKYQTVQQFVDSTLAARLNGYVGGNGSTVTAQREIELYDLSPAARARLESILGMQIAPQPNVCPVSGVGH